MQQNSDYSGVKISNWGRAVENSRFRNRLIAAVILFTGILMVLPSFFRMIEKREGVVLDDVLLRNIHPVDLSLPIFILIWSTTALFLIRAYNRPMIFLNAIFCVILLTSIRMITIYTVALDPPPTIIAIKDPLTSLTYGGKDIFITKDLFFSGHTSNMLVLACCFERKFDRIIGFIATFTVAVFLLFQHAHYTIDIVAAIVITFLVVGFVKRQTAKCNAASAC